MFTFLIFIAVLAILVLAHEIGHFFVARRAGVRVDEFGFGFPPRIVGVYRDLNTGKLKFVGFKKLRKEESAKNSDCGSITVETETVCIECEGCGCVVCEQTGLIEIVEGAAGSGTIYSLNLIPLGGFVKIKGEDGMHEEDEDSFSGKKPGIRAIILSAGVLMNVVVAAVLLSVGFMIGIPAVISEEMPEGARVTEQQVGVFQVLKDSPAEAAGLLVGDAVLTVNGNAVTNQDEAFNEIGSAASVGNVELKIQRGEEVKSFVISPTQIDEVGNQPAIGVALVDTGLVSLPWYRAILQGILATGIFLWEIIRAFGLIIANIFRGAPVAENMAGPVGIAVMTGQAARLGISYLVHLTALISLNLALINILPFPALDGGRLLFVAIEKVRRGKKVSQNVERWIHTAGFALLLFLVIVVTFRDIGRFF